MYVIIFKVYTLNKHENCMHNDNTSSISGIGSYKNGYYYDVALVVY